MIHIIEAIKAINPDAKVTVAETGNVDTAEITWLEGTAEISKADIKTKLDELQAEYDALDYARKREEEYPSVQDLVVALYDTEDKIAIDIKRAEIKLKYPKP
jgi:hypothetical protein